MRVAGSLAALFHPEDNLAALGIQNFQMWLEKKIKLLGALPNTRLAVEAHVMILCSCA